ncbi:hypothetical protein AB5J62_25710 [Amycolatopsis sp. cg5]|uniref:hypothetical protein n=1 Tax=Amycolatopsis sp. cg5 TaxID=3238802 RepID=UPI0035242D1B
MHEQHGVVSGAQLRAFGHTRHDLAANVEAGRWQQVLPRTYATFTGELSRAAKLQAALLYGGGHATLSHRTAAEEWGMLPISDGPIEITVPYNSSAISQLPFTKVHRSRALRHTALAMNPPRTRRTDTIIDLAVAEDTGQEALNTVVDLVSKHAVSVPDMLACVECRPPRRHRTAIAHGLELVRRGLMSALEVEYLDRVERAHGFPDGDRQSPLVVDGKTLWEDVTYDGAGIALTVRLDGRASHSMAGVAFRDRRRDNAAELAGRSRLVYGWHDVHGDPCGVAREVAAVLRRFGWQEGRRGRECFCRLEPAVPLTSPLH